MLQANNPTLEFDLYVLPFGNVGVYGRYPDGRVILWTYERTIERALWNYRHWPVRITTQGNSKFGPETV